MNVIESLGLLKMDFLGLRTLTVLDDAVKIVRRTWGVDLDLEEIPLDDPETFRIFSRRAHQRHLPVRIARHDRPAAAVQALALRGAGGA